MQDDFAWLGLNLRFEEGQSIWGLLFRPSGHGTLRPLSERLFFLVFYQLFGLDAFPFRLWIYATQIANLILLAFITRRLTGSRHAGFWAPVFWTVNTAVAGTLTWICAYNQILCGFFILVAFACLLEYVASGRSLYYALQWIAFLLGFGALEINLVYPMLAAAWCWCCARKYLWTTAPMFVVSAGYVVANLVLVPKAAEGPYSMHFDFAVPSTFAKYWVWAFGGMGLPRLRPAAIAVACILTTALVGFVVYKLRRREWAALFLLLWFPLVVSPVLPLRDHFTDYYLTLPAIGIAMLGAWAFAEAWKAGLIFKLAGVVLAAMYLAPSIAVTHSTIEWNLARSEAVRGFVLGVGRAQDVHAGKIILLDGVPQDLFWSAMRDKAFDLVSAREVYLTPEAGRRIPGRPELADVNEFVLPPGPMLQALSAGDAVVYDASKSPLRNTTMVYAARARSAWKREPARRVDVGKPLFREQIGDGWYPIERGYRWMTKRALVRLGGPRSAGEKLYITGYSSRAQLEKGPVGLSVSMDGRPLGVVRLIHGDAQFDANFDMPDEFVGKASVEVQLSVDRTFFVPGEKRHLGAAFGVLAIR
jgi:hypothetical protein